ncbi:HTH-type transcriptional activator IlvY [Ningiella sp. W23]|uniref:HTH-type transcriptional activator IlvY n=1 Tax=Ningiella sp. W23 TaxID=3023715 RepID=UPI003756FFB9
MDIKSLKLFQHLASSLNFSKTAEAMFVSPPTLSRIINRLEDECGSALFIRNNRRVSITASGKALLEFANQTLTQYALMKQSMRSHEQALSGELSFYCSVTASQSYLPTMLDTLHQHFPLVEIKLDTGDHALALDKVSARQADLALAIYTPDFPQHVSFAAIDTVPLVLIVPKNMEVDRWQDMNWQKVDAILPARGPSKRIVHHWFAEQNIRPKVYAQVSGNEAIVSMVSLGLGVGFVPKIVLENSVVKNKVRALKVTNIEAYHLGLCYLKERAQEPLLKNLTQLLLS